nr:WG repeat-containing protein [Planosporangium thailandense]
MPWTRAVADTEPEHATDLSPMAVAASPSAGTPATGVPVPEYRLPKRVVGPPRREEGDTVPVRVPTPSAPVSGAPVSAASVSPAPVAEAPVAEAPVAEAPVSGPAVSGPPVSGPAVSVPALPAPRPPETSGALTPPADGPTPADAPAPPADAPAPDPERILADYRWRFDPDTLREVVEEPEIDELTEVRRLLTGKLEATTDNGSRARLLSLRAVVSRVLGDLDQALADAERAVAHAEATGQLRRITIAQARLARVLQWRGEYTAADRLFALANSTELPDRLRSAMHQHAGLCAYEQGRFIEACNHFERALDLRGGGDPDLIAQIELALDAVYRRATEAGWGRYPRSRDEILGIRKALTATFDDVTRRWGYTDELGVFRIPPRFTDAQPFRDGVAWVQRPGSRNWELIDDGGELLIDRTAGYRGVGNFADGVAWVSRDGVTGWIAIDKANTVLVATGFDDVRPFRGGLAAVRSGGRWGAVDAAGRLVVPLHYDGFVTALHDGRYIDGFSDEGLAVVALGSGKGVVDRTGSVIVPPVYPTVVIHPVAFLVTDPAHRWGALDRQGRPLLETELASRDEVTHELDRLLSDARPIL